jgi:uncharacterized protein with PQ loop repeat
MLGLFGLTMLVFSPVLFKVIKTHHKKDPVFMAMLILLQLTLAAYLYFFGYYIVQFKGEIARQQPNIAIQNHNYYCNTTISGSLGAYMMAFATILNVYKWHYIKISIKAISEGLVSQ